MLSQIAFLHLMVQLSGFGAVSGEFTSVLRSLVVLREWKKGRVLVELGRRQQLVWFMHCGTAKEVSMDGDGTNARVSWFWFSSDFLFSFPGFFAQEPALAAMELVEDCVLLEISYGELMGLRERFSEVSLLVERIRAAYEKNRVLHAGDLVNLSAKERFDKFFGLHKGLFNVARHKDIAGFLGIKDDGLHRYW